MADERGYQDDLDGAAERRLAEHLELVRAHPPEAEPTLARRIIQRAGWQRLARLPLEIVGALIAAVGDAVTIFTGTTGRGSRGSR